MSNLYLHLLPEVSNFFRYKKFLYSYLILLIDENYIYYLQFYVNMLWATHWFPYVYFKNQILSSIDEPRLILLAFNSKV